MTTPWVRGLVVVGLVYAVAMAVAAPVAWLAMQGGWGLLWSAAAADGAATLVVFTASIALRNSSVYDPYWSVIPPVLVVFWSMNADDVGIRHVLITVVVFAWAARLTWNWARGWPGLRHEDWRYVDLRARSGPLFQLVNLTGIMGFPTVLVFLGCVPLFRALTSPADIGVLDAIAAAVALLGVAIEAAADRQLLQFRRGAPSPDAILQTGLWAWSRHPNYLGEITFWLGLALFGLAADPGWWPSLLGVTAIVGLFWFISVPLIERRMVRRRPHYVEVQGRIPMILPWPPRA